MMGRPDLVNAGACVSPRREHLIALLRSRGHERRAEPFQLASGEWSRDYVDGKRAIADGEALRLASEVILELAADAGVEFDAVGGLTMGSDPLAHGVALVGGGAWFSVRKTTKTHGKQKRIEGTELAPGDRVLLVDDVVTTGGSILEALDAVEEAGARVVLAVTLLDRGEAAAPFFGQRGIPYAPVATYTDLGIEPVGGSAAAPSAG